MSNITIGIEGLVGAGKTSLCRELVKMIPNSIILHGGNLYRGIVFALMNNQLNINEILNLDTKNMDALDIKQLMDNLNVKIDIKNNESVVYVNNKEVDEKNLQSDINSLAVSKIASIADNTKLYLFAKTLINNYKDKYNVIISGRDLMRIYPDLNYHFFITADLDERINRKMSQYKNEKISEEDIRKHIEQRDFLQEKSGFYMRYINTIDIDVTNCKSAEESAKKVLSYIHI